MNYLSSDSMTVRNGTGSKRFVKIRTRQLHVYNLLLAMIGKKGELPGVRVNFPKEGVSNELDGIFTKTGLKSTLNRKHHKTLDILFTFVSAFIDLCFGFRWSALLTKVRTRYSKIICAVTGKRGNEVRDVDEFSMLDNRVQAFKRLLEGTFDAHCDSGLYTL